MAFFTFFSCLLTYYSSDPYWTYFLSPFLCSLYSSFSHPTPTAYGTEDHWRIEPFPGPTAPSPAQGDSSLPHITATNCLSWIPTAVNMRRDNISFLRRKISRQCCHWLLFWGGQMGHTRKAVSPAWAEAGQFFDGTSFLTIPKIYMRNQPTLKPIPDCCHCGKRPVTPNATSNHITTPSEQKTNAMASHRNKPWGLKELNLLGIPHWIAAREPPRCQLSWLNPPLIMCGKSLK